jgi:hypothetical protein
VIATIVVALAVVAIAGPQPKFPNDWSALEDDSMAVFQGQVITQGSKMCCDTHSNCQVQVQYQLGNVYVDYTNNRTRFDDRISGQDIVTLYKIQKTMLVVNQTCKEYCPLQGDVMSPGFLDPNATDKGPVTLPDGRKAEHWQWKDTIFGIIVMEINDVYVNQADMSNAVPYGEVDHLTPFGEHIGDMTTNWNDFKAGTPDPALFNIAGVDSCPMSPNCGSELHQMHRIRSKQMKSWMKYYQEAKEAASENKF